MDNITRSKNGHLKEEPKPSATTLEFKSPRLQRFKPHENFYHSAANTSNVSWTANNVNTSIDPAQQSQPAQRATALPTILACDLYCKMNKTCLEWKHLKGRFC